MKLPCPEVFADEEAIETLLPRACYRPCCTVRKYSLTKERLRQTALQRELRRISSMATANRGE